MNNFCTTTAKNKRLPIYSTHRAQLSGSHITFIGMDNQREFRKRIEEKQAFDAKAETTTKRAIRLIQERITNIIRANSAETVRKTDLSLRFKTSSKVKGLFPKNSLCSINF